MARKDYNKAKIKNLIDEQIEMELYNDNGEQWLWLCTENSSGAKYRVKTFADIGVCVADYVRCYLSTDKEN